LKVKRTNWNGFPTVTRMCGNNSASPNWLVTAKANFSPARFCNLIRKWKNFRFFPFSSVWWLHFLFSANVCTLPREQKFKRL
jgi:hypothetical protein